MKFKWHCVYIFDSVLALSVTKPLTVDYHPDPSFQVHEKVVLPTAEDIKQEKVHESLLQVCGHHLGPYWW